MSTKPKKAYDRSEILPEIYYSVEFGIDGFAYLFQFKIWNTPEKPMFILVPESSDILGRIKKGDVIKMRYYSQASDYPTEFRTAIEYIENDAPERFKGHKLVGLKILPNQYKK